MGFEDGADKGCSLAQQVFLDAVTANVVLKLFIPPADDADDMNATVCVFPETRNKAGGDGKDLTLFGAGTWPF